MTPGERADVMAEAEVDPIRAIAFGVARDYTRLLGKTCDVFDFQDGFGVGVSGLFLAEVKASGEVVHRARLCDLADAAEMFRRMAA